MTIQEEPKTPALSPTLECQLSWTTLAGSCFRCSLRTIFTELVLELAFSGERSCDVLCLLPRCLPSSGMLTTFKPTSLVSAHTPGDYCSPSETATFCEPSWF
ncbi:mCG1051077 [Mus musculus]|nr:mCG1051077 [Mus musculus]